MAQILKVAELDEVPPGKGKTILVDGREVTVYNQEGRYIATSRWTRRLTGPAPKSARRRAQSTKQPPAPRPP